MEKHELYGERQVNPQELGEMARSDQQLALLFGHAAEKYRGEGLADVAEGFEEDRQKFAARSGRSVEEIQSALEAETREEAEAVRAFFCKMGEWLEESASKYEHIRQIENDVKMIMGRGVGDYAYPAEKIAHEIEKILDLRPTNLPPMQNRRSGRDLEDTSFFTAIDRVVAHKLQEWQEKERGYGSRFPTELEFMSPRRWEELKKKVGETNQSE
ncbi:MAG: hypothetical protein Q8Q94_00365 [bacterium]|nr:hypothetical protein [bacterium]MDZ4299941.1 hypothetical protein [Candidatus Sungbacteria bacterium]